MNKTNFINELKTRVQLTDEQATTVNDVFENNFVIRKKNEEKIVAQIVEALGVDECRAKEIYDCGYDLIGGGIVGKLKHPFGAQD